MARVSQSKARGSHYRRCIASLTLVSLLSGCGNRSAPAHGPFGPPVSSPLLAPFQGVWKLDAEKTIEVHKAGAPTERIAALRKMYEPLVNLHGILTIKDNEALGIPFPSSEYRFFHLHRHGATVCGKAWHHEDRFDPGDMQKCRVQLEMIDGCLHFRSWMTEGLPVADDPDFDALPVDLDAPANCPIETAKDATQIVVFVRPAGK